MTRGRAVLLAALAATSLAAVPFFFATIPALVDYPNHLARMFILSHWDAIPALQEFYLPDWHLLPNIGMDAAVVPLVRATGWDVVAVVRVFTALACAAIVPATMLLGYAFHRRWSAWSAASLLFAFNYVLLYGFVNYVAGIDLAVAAAALWILNRARDPRILAAAFALPALALFFVHLYAFLYYGALVGGYEAWMLWNTSPRLPLLRRQSIAALQFLPPLFIFFAFSPTAGNLSFARIKASSLLLKAIAIYAALDTGHRGLTLATFAAGCAVAGYGLLSRKLKLAPAGAVMVLLLALVFLIMPFTLLGSGFADYRLPFAIAPVLLAATRWENLGLRPKYAIAALLAALALLRTVSVAQDFRQGDRRYAQIINALAPMQAGKTLLPLIAAEDADADFLRHPPIEHAAELAVLSKHAFVPTLFAEPSKQPMAFQPAVAALAFDSPLMPLYGAALPANLGAYDYVLIFAKHPERIALPPGLRRIDDGSAPDMALYAVLPH